MKIILTKLLLFTLFFLGCADTPNFPIENDDHSYQFIKLPKKSGMTVETEFSVTETIDGAVGATVILNERYVTEDGHTVKIYVKLKAKKNSFDGEVTISLTVDDEFASAQFSPAMDFDIPLELDIKFEGIDINLTNGDYDFVFIDDDGNLERVTFNAIHVDESQGKISVIKAKLHHFSRYGFIN